MTSIITELEDVLSLSLCLGEDFQDDNHAAELIKNLESGNFYIKQFLSTILSQDELLEALKYECGLDVDNWLITIDDDLKELGF